MQYNIVSSKPFDTKTSKLVKYSLQWGNSNSYYNEFTKDFKSDDGIVTFLDIIQYGKGKLCQAES